MKRRTYGILAAMLFLLSGCGEEGASDVESEYEIWSAPNTLKVLRDAHIYEEIKGIASVSMTVARGEYESAQLILEAETRIDDFDVRASGLTDGKGSVISADNISVFAEKYILVDTINEQNGALLGYYPDCLVPMENYAAAGENFVEAGCNQGLWITFRIPSDAEPGTYTGALQIVADGEINDIPVALNVSELAVSETVRTKSVFLNQFDYYKGELDSTLSMYKKYNDALLEFRLAPDVLYDRQYATEEGYALYAELAYEYASNPRCSNFTIPYEKASGEENIDAEVMRNYLIALAEKSFETGTDILAKAVFYCRLIDEPGLKQIDATVANVCNTFRNTLASVSREISEGYPEADAELRSAVAQSVSEIPNIVTTEWSERFAEYIDCWCPTVDNYDTEADRQKYAEQEERWWYTCSLPKTPYPTYHMEDSLLSARIMGWMQADYEVVGNLYWATNFSSEFIENDSQAIWLEDYYQTADRYKGANGDGFLFYPGKKYGVDGPLASLRLHAIRDGLEEYELLYDLKETYRRAAEACSMEFTADSVLDSVFSNLYDGTKVSTTDEKLAQARAQLFDLAALAASPAEVCVAEFSETDGKVTYEVAAKKEYPLYCDGQPCTEFVESGDYRYYTVEKSLSDKKNTLSLSVVCDDKTYTYDVYLGGKYTKYTADIVRNWTDAETQLVNASDYLPGETGQFLSVPFNEGDSGESIRLEGELSANFGAAASRLRIVLYNPDEKEISVFLGIKYRDTGLKQKLISERVIAPGEVVTIDIRNIYGFSWNLYGATEYFELGINGGETCRLLIGSVEFYME